LEKVQILKDATEELSRSQARRVAFFVENRNGVHLSLQIAARLPEGSTFELVTADPEGTVEQWIKAGLNDLGEHATYVNVFPREGAVARDWTDQLPAKMADWVRREQVDSVVLFNDRSRRGRQVMAGVRDKVATILVQDGHLHFHFRRANLLNRDQNWSYGATQPSVTCVWGDTTGDFIRGRDPHFSAHIAVTGAIGVSDNREFSTHARMSEPVRRTDPDREPFFIIADQALQEQRKCSRADHQGLLVATVNQTRKVGSFLIKPHPSSSKQHIAWLREQFGAENVGLLSRGLAEDLIADVDGIVTFYSSIYTDALKNQVPLIFVGSAAVDAVMPRIAHPLIRNVASTTELGTVLDRYVQSGVFPANKAGFPIDKVIARNPDPAGACVREILRAQIARPLDPEPAVPSDPLIENLDWEFEMSNLPNRIAVVGDDFAYSTGIAIPLQTAIEAMGERQRGNITLIDTRAYLNVKSLTDELLRYDVVLVNSLAPFWRSRVFSSAVRNVVHRGTPVAVYAHETEWVIKYERERVPDRHQNLLNLLPMMDVLCVSQHQMKLFTSLGAGRVHWVLNTAPGLGGVLVPRMEGKPAEKMTVMMAGTVQERKGAGLFCAVADLAHAQGLPFRFVWAGRKTPHLNEDTELSQNVEWLGAIPRSQLSTLMTQSDVFLLSSADDPMPLAALEAGQHRMRIVTYAGVGTSEIFDGARGYASFEEYSAPAVLEAITRAIAVDVDAEAYAKRLGLFSPRALRNRIASVLAIVVAGHGRSQAAVGTRDQVLLVRSVSELLVSVARFLGEQPGSSDVSYLIKSGRSMMPRDLYVRLVNLLGGETWGSARVWLDLSEACRIDRGLLGLRGYEYACRALNLNPQSRKAPLLIEEFAVWLPSNKREAAPARAGVLGLLARTGR
jgi:hypothetical protein